MQFPVTQRRIGADPSRLPGAQPEGIQQARAMEQLGGAVAQIATKGIAQQTALDMDELRRQEAAREAADRARDALALQTAEDALREEHDDLGRRVLSGELPKEKAGETWAERARAAVDGAMPNLREGTRELVRPRLEKLSASLDRSLRRVVETKDRQDVTAGVETRLERLARDYMADPGRAEAEAMTLFDTLGPQTMWTSQQREQKRQAWKEAAQYAAGRDLVNRSRDDPKALDAAEARIAQLGDLDPNRRIELEDRIRSHRIDIANKAERDAAKRAREAEAHLKRAEAEFTAAQSLADGGTLRPEYTDRVLGKLAGTPYQAAFRELLKRQAETGPLAAQPLPQLQAAIQALDADMATNGRDPQRVKRRDQLERVYRQAQQDYENDPLPAAVERSVIPGLAPIDLSTPQGIASSIGGRVQQAAEVQRVTGKPVSPLTKTEADTLRTTLNALPPKDKSQTIAIMAQAMGPNAATGLARQLGQNKTDDRALELAFGLAGSGTTEGRFTSELILKGQQAKRDGTSTKGEVKPDVAVSSWSATIGQQIADVFPTQTMTDGVRDAAVLIAHGIASENGGRLRGRDLERAVEFAIGGSIVERNGRRVPMPAGMTEEAFDAKLRSITLDEINASGPEVLVAGQRVQVADFVQGLPSAQLIYAGPGQYNVLAGGRPVLNAKGERVRVRVQ
jgi:hypothetical protein